MSTPAEPELTDDELRAVARGVMQFNHGLYFECHETLEHVWSGLHGPERDFFQGLIQVSVGHHHLGRSNFTGALRTFTRALGRFDAYPGRYCGFNLAAERARVEALLAALTTQGSGVPKQPAKWRFDGLADADQGNPG